MPTSMPSAPAMSTMPAVTFQPGSGSRVVFMKEASHINECHETEKIVLTLGYGIEWKINVI